jgi:hypothetical protein
MTSFPTGVFGTRSKPLGALELLLHAWAWHFFYHARAKILAAVARPFAWRNVTTTMAAAHACKLEAWPTCLLRTAKPRNYEESSTLAWAWH